MSSFVVDSRDNSIDLHNFDYDGMKINNISDILLLGYGKDGSSNKFLSFCVNPNEFYKEIGWNWKKSDKVSDSTWWGFITPDYHHWAPQRTLSLGDKDDKSSFYIGDKEIKTNYGVWADCESTSSYQDPCQVSSGKTTGFYTLLNDATTISKIMTMGYKMFIMGDVRHYLNWVSFGTSNYLSSDRKFVRKYFRVFYRTLPNRILFTPSLLYGPNGEDAIRLEHRDKIIEYVGNALKGNCTEDFEYQDISTSNMIITYNDNPLYVFSNGNVFRGFCVNEDQFIEPGDGLFSPNLKYKAVVEYNGNFVVYTNEGNDSKEIWKVQKDVVSSFDGSKTPSCRTRLFAQSDENVVLYDRLGVASWATGTSFKPGNKVKLILDNNGYLILLSKRVSTPEEAPYYRRGSGLLNFKCVCGMESDKSTCKQCTPEELKKAYKDLDCVRDWKIYKDWATLESDELQHIKKDDDTRNWCYVNNYDLYTYHIKWVSKKNPNGGVIGNYDVGSTTYGELAKRSKNIFNPVCAFLNEKSTVDLNLNAAADSTKYKYCIRGDRIIKDQKCVEWWKRLKTNWGVNGALSSSEKNAKEKLDTLAKKLCRYDWVSSYPNAKDDLSEYYDRNDEEYKKFCSCYTPVDLETRAVWIANKARNINISKKCEDGNCEINGYQDNNIIKDTCNLQICYQKIELKGDDANYNVKSLGQDCNMDSTKSKTPSESTPPPSENAPPPPPPPPDSDFKPWAQVSKWYHSPWFYPTVGIIIFIIILAISITLISGKSSNRRFAAINNMRMMNYGAQPPMYTYNEPPQPPMYNYNEPPQPPMYAYNEPLQPPMYNSLL